jgi:hypothetical protein
MGRAHEERCGLPEFYTSWALECPEPSAGVQVEVFNLLSHGTSVNQEPVNNTNVDRW